MKYKFLIILLFVFLACASKSDSNKQLIVEFVEKFTQSEEVTLEDIKKYVKIDNGYLDNPAFLELLDDRINILKNELTDFNAQEQIKSRNDVADIDINLYEQNYSKYPNVYFIVKEGKILRAIIVENGKIVSFFSNLEKHRNRPKTPIILNLKE